MFSTKQPKHLGQIDPSGKLVPLWHNDHVVSSIMGGVWKITTKMIVKSLSLYKLFGNKNFSENLGKTDIFSPPFLNFGGKYKKVSGTSIHPFIHLEQIIFITVDNCWDRVSWNSNKLEQMY